MDLRGKIYVAGHRGLVGSAVTRRLQAEGDRISAQAARYADTAALFHALGGGWWNRDKAETPKGAKSRD